MEEELQSHIDLRAVELQRSGLSATEARRQARIEFGSAARFKEECRDRRICDGAALYLRRSPTTPSCRSCPPTSTAPDLVR